VIVDASLGIEHYEWFRDAILTRMVPRSTVLIVEEPDPEPLNLAMLLRKAIGGYALSWV